MKYLFLGLFPVLFSISLTCQSQYVDEPGQKKSSTVDVRSENTGNSAGFDPDRLVPGGNFAINFGNPFFIDISPRLGYLVTDKLLLGLGGTYMSFSSTFGKANFFGGQAFSRFQVMDNFFANAELDFLNVPDLYGNLDGGRKWLVSPLIGGSYVVPFGKRGGIQATLLYNLNYQNAYSPYASPIIWRMGFFL